MGTVILLFFIGFAVMTGGLWLKGFLCFIRDLFR